MSSIGTKFVLAQRFVFDPNNNSLTDQFEDNHVVRMGSNESRILQLFSEKPNQVISRDQLHEYVWRDQGFQVDDSSLTQAISTLRKILQDSIKSPRFIKTVPKRGYQFIASVELTVPLASSEQDAATSQPLKKENSGTAAGDSKSKPIESNQADSPLTNRRAGLKQMLVLAISVLLPLIAYIGAGSAPTQLMLIDTISGIPLKTTESHPSLDEWKPSVKNCVDVYLESHQQKPIEVIATTGSNQNLILNYVHAEQDSAMNVTIQLVAKERERSDLCD